MAAANNAEWCDLVCRTYGAQTRFDEDAWTSRTRTPPGYPDAVTLVPHPSAPDLLARIDTSAGCSIKDSFASMDMTTYGFRVLFDAQWIVSGDSCPAKPRRRGLGGCARRGWPRGLGAGVARQRWPSRRVLHRAARPRLRERARRSHRRRRCRRRGPEPQLETCGDFQLLHRCPCRRGELVGLPCPGRHPFSWIALRRL